MKKLLLLTLFLFPSILGAADDFKIGLPLKCKVGVDCFIQNFVDVHRESSPNKPRDFKCGSLVYKGHKGTDFRVKTYENLKEGMKILAVADGTVKAIRNDMEEGHAIHSNAIKGKECGNGLVVTHGNGWETQYCHMKQGSVSVRVGQKLSRGDVVGKMGMSGKTQFPHIHLSVRKGKKVIDPFIGVVDKTTKCGGVVKSLWTKDAESQILPYRSTGALGAGFTDGRPNQEAVMKGKHAKAELTSEIDKLIFWIYLYGVRKGDEEEFVLKDPNGKTIFKKRMKSVKKNKATWLRFVGKRVNLKTQKPKAPKEEEEPSWTTDLKKFLGLSKIRKTKGFLTEGTYTGEYRLIRQDDQGNDQTIINLTREVTVVF